MRLCILREASLEGLLNFRSIIVYISPKYCSTENINSIFENIKKVIDINMLDVTGELSAKPPAGRLPPMNGSRPDSDPTFLYIYIYPVSSC